MKNLMLGLCFPLLLSCGGDDSQEQLTQQIARGVTAYTANCATCHGDMGQGTEMGPPVVGEGVFPKTPRMGSARMATFTTAADVFAWAKANMPPTAPGTIADETLLAIFAFDLDANGVTLEKPLDAETASAIVLNP